jgi:hypothetical protein
MKALVFSSCALLFLLSSCNTVWLEKPVPQSGADLTIIPAVCSGVFEISNRTGETDTSIFKQCLRLDRQSSTRLFISSEVRLAKKDAPLLEHYLLQEQKAGRISDFQIAGQFIYCTVQVEVAGKGNKSERRIVKMVDQGNWYVLANTIEPYMQIDLQDRAVRKFELTKGHVPENSWLPGADSLSVSLSPISFRTLHQRYYLNIQDNNSGKWSFYSIWEAEKDRLVLTLGYLKDKKQFEAHLSQYNRITPFKLINSDYSIDPTDDALQQLLDQPDLFDTWNLKKIEG